MAETVSTSVPTTRNMEVPASVVAGVKMPMEEAMEQMERDCVQDKGVEKEALSPIR